MNDEVNFWWNESKKSSKEKEIATNLLLAVAS
jgi:hypothetical protein